MNEYVVLSWYNRFEVAEQVGMDPDDLLVIWRQTANAGFYCLFYRRETEKWRTIDVHDSVSVEMAIDNLI
jgi:hypothetical protein